MLVLEQYGIRLRRINLDDIELIRQWRNSEFVRKKMIYQKVISQKEQQQWFDSVNNSFNYYFMIEHSGEKIGVINAKSYSTQLGFGEGGIFMKNEQYTNSLLPAYSTLCLLNAVFLELNLCELSKIQVLKRNTKTISYNQLLGYQVTKKTSRGMAVEMVLTKSRYQHYSQRINRAAGLLTAQPELTVTGKPSDLNLPEINNYLIGRSAP
jgi:UDP-4-amino-4,6-dideoxy-N-acetyl-beta-L-altrosamine N-acetyltransferase